MFSIRVVLAALCVAAPVLFLAGERDAATTSLIAAMGGYLVRDYRANPAEFHRPVSHRVTAAALVILMVLVAIFVADVVAGRL